MHVVVAFADESATSNEPLSPLLLAEHLKGSIGHHYGGSKADTRILGVETMAQLVLSCECGKQLVLFQASDPQPGANFK